MKDVKRDFQIMEPMSGYEKECEQDRVNRLLCFKIIDALLKSVLVRSTIFTLFCKIWSDFAAKQNVQAFLQCKRLIC